MDIKEILERNPVIPAVKNDTYLNEAIESGSEIVFVIMSNLMNVKDIVNRLKDAGKIVFVHVDMIDGFSSSNCGVEYIRNYTRIDGIITTKHNIASFAKKAEFVLFKDFLYLTLFLLKIQ